MFGLTGFGADTLLVLNGTLQEKAAAAQTLGYAKDERAVDALAKAALDNDLVVANAAADALGAIGTSQAADALLTALKGGSLDSLAGGTLRCAEARRLAQDMGRAKELFALCFEKGAPKQKAAALLGLAQIDPVMYADAISRALQGADPVMARAAVAAVTAEGRLAAVALAALPALKDEAKARVLTALIPHAEAAGVKQALRAALTDEALPVRLAGMRAAVRTADAAALPALFALTAKPDEEGRAATLAMAAMSAKGTDDFLYGEMKKDGPELIKAIGLLASRGQPELVQRLCDASLYAVAGVNTAVGDAFRACVRQENFAQALTFTFGPLPAAQRGPVVSALASVVQQLPDEARAIRDVAEVIAKADAAEKMEILTLLGGLQTEAARDLLVAQTKAGDSELRKSAVRVLSQWNSPLAVAPLMTVARQDADRSVRILAVRGLLALLQKPNVMAKDQRLAVMTELAGVAERIEEKKALHSLVKATGGKAADALRKQLAESCGLTNVQEHVVAAVNAGGGAVGEFKADTGFSGGSVFAVKLEADTTDASDAAPEEVYQSCRFRDSTYIFGGLKPGQGYTLRLHFAETFHERAGLRVFDVVANGKTVLADYDILAKSGKKMKAVTEAVDVAADAAGKLAVAFKTKRDQALVNGLEVLEVGSAREDIRPPTPVQKVEGERPRDVVAKPGQLRVLLLTGANNHNWQATTAALKEIFAESPKFFVTVNEKPWEMKPSDLASCDLIFSNWNTFGKGKDAPEWSAEMKAAFMAWIKKGGGFVVMHSGGCLFYDWDEFQSLTGGAWEKGTFHPHMQNFTVNIADKEHPVTRGMKDFETYDEPWQKTGNRNPNRHVLVSGVVSKENKGSGEPEPFAWVTEVGKGRCFNLVLGHDIKALGNAGCRTLILRGAEWAATGVVK